VADKSVAAAQTKFAESLVSPLPLYFGICGQGHSGRVICTPFVTSLMSGYRVLSEVSEPGEHQATDFAPFVLSYLVVKVAEPLPFSPIQRANCLPFRP
jgi:hypothetical protein